MMKQCHLCFTEIIKGWKNKDNKRHMCEDCYDSLTNYGINADYWWLKDWDQFEETSINRDGD